MRKDTVFDSYGAINESRKAFLKRVLAGLIGQMNIRTALDLGCGVGCFTNCMASMGLDVTGVDARADNISEARKRYPEVAFCVQDAEGSAILEMKPKDMVLCFGLLYHLENPFRVIRNLYALTKELTIIESMIVPQQVPAAVLLDERRADDQSLHCIAFVPSEEGLVKMLYRAGFLGVYRPTMQPEHDDFKETLRFRRRRSALVATKSKINSTMLVEIPEPRLENVWRRHWHYQMERIFCFLGRSPS
jgi:SAM-dependent methyltransferase